ncbi:glycosyltransferase [Gracilimonas sp.]|uniref:glycosyltransferase n=1 Tax=Gracilimonas sp. TaxID=1974203 RepID=UPI0032EECC29
MEVTSLKEIYASVNEDARIVYVVPLIRFSHKKSDYLYLLYKELIEGKEYDIQSISVFNHFKLVAGILSNRQAILHYHWLEFQDFKSLLGMPWKMLCLYFFHKLGGNIVWTLHNEFPHDQKYLGLHSYLHKKMASWSKVLHVHCEKAVKLMSNRLEVSEDKFRLIPHPDFPAEPIDKDIARDKLNEHYNCELKPDLTTILMFGNISRYKQIEKVSDLVIELKQECKLLVVGPVKKGNMKLFDQLEARQKKSNRIKVIPHFIDEKQVPWFYSAADLCVFNYREILSSGGYHMAKAYHKKIIAPDMGCLSEEGKETNVDLFTTQDELSQLLQRQLQANKNG